MRYMGGKFRQSKIIAKHLATRYAGQKTYIEPFCGGMGSAEKVIPALAELGVENFILHDISIPLINMWKLVIQHKWIPPDTVSEEEWKRIRLIRDPDDPMTAYCGFAMSFGGRWFEGFARAYDKNRTIEKDQLNQKTAVLRKAAVLRKHNTKVKNKNYRNIIITNAIMYLDPPYEGRTKAHNFNTFDYNHFNGWARDMAKNNDVLLTGFECPNEWRPIHHWGDTTAKHYNSKGGNNIDEQLLEFIGSID